MDTATVTSISDYIRANQSTPFEWGKFDCCVFVAHIIKLQTNIDLYAPYSGKYNSERSALLAQRRIGTIESQLDKHFERVDPLTAKRGDIHMLEDGTMSAQFSGYKWATCDTGVNITRKASKICWRIK